MFPMSVSAQGEMLSVEPVFSCSKSVNRKDNALRFSGCEVAIRCCTNLQDLQNRCPFFNRSFFFGGGGGGGEFDATNVCNNFVCGNMLSGKEDAESHVCEVAGHDVRFCCTRV